MRGTVTENVLSWLPARNTKWQCPGSWRHEGASCPSQGYSDLPQSASLILPSCHLSPQKMIYPCLICAVWLQVVYKSVHRTILTDTGNVTYRKAPALPLHPWLLGDTEERRLICLSLCIFILSRISSFVSIYSALLARIVLPIVGKACVLAQAEGECCQFVSGYLWALCEVMRWAFCRWVPTIAFPPWSSRGSVRLLWLRLFMITIRNESPLITR